MFRLALALSAGIVLGCGVWWHQVTSGNGPDRSVDLRPLAPIVVGTASLFVIWVVAIVIVAIRSGSRADDDRTS